MNLDALKDMIDKLHAYIAKLESEAQAEIDKLTQHAGSVLPADSTPPPPSGGGPGEEQH